MNATLDLLSFNAALEGTRFHGRVHHFAVIDSTNTYALAEAAAGAEAGQVYLADEQTAGRGRGGHTWHSEPERGLYLTVLLRPPLHSSQTLALSMLAGLAAQSAIRQGTGLLMDLRWPNDLVVGSHPARKLGGILTEAASTPAGDVRHAAVGIGINLNQGEFPADLAVTATSLRREAGHTVSREAVAIALLRALHVELAELEQAHSAAAAVLAILQRFSENSTWARGKQVRVEEGDGYTGVTAGLTSDGLLRVQCSDGVERVVRHGGVRELEGR